ncbi:hypothetical protein BB561_001506 [Smittium simulii]|uniref:Uncharacterized protein n=1 Tax=Smittium simulii TaxID=133385 RepID=A0A2T9YUH2_9FUNG|nr:hypothetical protein BB561_001506 [Smittium simulii]
MLIHSYNGIRRNKDIYRCVSNTDLVPNLLHKDIYRCVSNTDLVPNLLRKKLVGEFLGGELKISVSVIRKKENVRSVNMTLATASFLTLIHTSRLLILERISVSPAPMNQSHHGGELKISVSVIRKKENVRSVNMTLATASFLTLIHTSRLLILERISVSPAPMNQSHHGTASLEGQEGIG